MSFQQCALSFTNATYFLQSFNRVSDMHMFTTSRHTHKHVGYAAVCLHTQVRPSAVVRFLITESMLGKCSVHFAAKVCELVLADFAVMQDGFDLPELKSLASRSGDRTHAWRDLVRSLIPADVPVAMFPIPIKDTSHCGWHLEEQSIILPHALFSAMYARTDSSFTDFLTGDDDKRRQFWDAVRSSPQFQETDLRFENFALLSQRMVPLQLHGDGVP